MEKFLLPNEHPYAVTLHFNGSLTKETVLNTIKTYPNYKRAIIGYETNAARPHFQCVICLKEIEKLGSRMPLKKFFHENFDCYDNSPAISYGRDSKKLRRYVLKESQWISDGFKVEDLKLLERTTYKKKEWLMERLDELELEYMDGKIDEVAYCCKFEVYKSQCNQVRNERQVENYVYSKYLKKYGSTKKHKEHWERRWDLLLNNF